MGLFLAYEAETLLGYAFGKVDYKYKIRWNAKSTLLATVCFIFKDPFTIRSLGQAKLIHSLSSRIFENHMWAGGHFSYFIA